MYSVAAHLALLAVSPLFLFPYFDTDTVATVMLWLCAFAFVWVFFEPSRMSGELLHESRARVLGGVLRDPLFWVMLLFVAVSALRWINSGVSLAYDVENVRWYMKEPMLASLPSAAEGHGKLEFAATLVATLVLMGIRHSLGKVARLSFLVSSSLFAAIAAVVAIGLAKFSGGMALVAAKATYANPSFVGGAFAVYGLAGLAGLAGALEKKWKSASFLSVIAVGGTFAGAYMFAPSASVMLYAIAAVVMILASIIWLCTLSHFSNAMKFFAIAFIGVAIAVLIAITIAPQDLVEARMADIVLLKLFPDNYEMIREILSRVAMKTWDDAQWLGGGLGTFSFQTRFIATPQDWPVILTARASALSAWWTLIAERGIVGAVMYAVPLALLLFTFFRRIPGAIGNPIYLPGCFLGFLTLALAVAEGFFDATFLRPELVVALMAFLAVSAGSLPAVHKKNDSPAAD